MMDIFLAKSSFHCFFYSYAFGEREGVCKKSMFCTLMKMMKKIADPLTVLHSW